MPRPMHMVGMQRVPTTGMTTAFNVASQAGIVPPNSGSIPMQRGAAAHAHQQQQQQQQVIFVAIFSFFCFMHLISFDLYFAICV